MKMRKVLPTLVCTMCFVLLSSWVASAQEKAASSTAQVHVVITDTTLRSDSELPSLKQDDVKVKQGRTFLQVTQLIPAQGDNAALQLMILMTTHSILPPLETT